MKYFKTRNPHRPYRLASGQLFNSWEPVRSEDGHWYGLAVVDGGTVDDLQLFGPPIEEITEAEYDDLKKKAHSLSSSSMPSSKRGRGPQSPMQVEARERQRAAAPDVAALTPVEVATQADEKALLQMGEVEIVDPLADKPVEQQPRKGKGK